MCWVEDLQTQLSLIHAVYTSSLLSSLKVAVASFAGRHDKRKYIFTPRVVYFHLCACRGASPRWLSSVIGYDLTVVRTVRRVTMITARREGIYNKQI